MRTKKGLKLLKIIFAIIIPLIFLILSVRVITTKMYIMATYNHYERHNEVYFDFEYATKNVVDYLNGKQDTLIFPTEKGETDILMTERGLKHMEDVKYLYNYGKGILLTLVLISITLGYYLFKQKQLAQTLKKVWIVPIVFALLLSLGMFIDFEWAFTLFHQLLFNNDLWLLDWNDPLLIMYPEDFFRNTGLIILGITIILSVITSISAKIIGDRLK